MTPRHLPRITARPDSIGTQSGTSAPERASSAHVPPDTAPPPPAHASLRPSLHANLPAGRPLPRTESYGNPDLLSAAAVRAPLSAWRGCPRCSDTALSNPLPH